jgi:hypothetical protein
MRAGVRDILEDAGYLESIPTLDSRRHFPRNTTRKDTGKRNESGDALLDDAHRYLVRERAPLFSSICSKASRILFIRAH